LQKSESAARDGIVIRECHGLSEFEACIQVERAAWKSADIDVVPLPLFVAAAETGGQVLGAFRGRELVGFTMAIAGWRNRRPLLHSHMTAVLEPYRDQGVGRRLKFFQREDALARAIALVEWTFDPLVAKNAYFNLMRLGAITRRYVPNAYGITTSPLHGALPTDRLVAEWRLSSTRVGRIVAGRKATPAFSKKAVRIAVPAAIEELKITAPREAAHLQNAVRAQFTRWFAKGYAATAVGRTSLGMDYILESWKKA
jgi:predicted GNAT superfamily acetyltransferase